MGKIKTVYNKDKNKFKNKLDRKSLYIMALSALLATTTSLSVYGLWIKPTTDYKRSKYVLESTMNMDTIKDLDNNMKLVYPCLTKELYSKYGLNDVNFTYYNYFKLRGDSTRVEVLDSHKGYSSGSITFRIKNGNININRRFLMLYKTKGSRLSDVQYVEVVGSM